MPLASVSFSSRKTGWPLSSLRPLDAVRPQRASQAHHVDDVPTGIAVAPGMFVGVVKISVKGVAGDFIIKTNAVVPHPASSGLGQLLVNLADELRLWQTFGQRLLGRDARHQTGLGMGQHIPRRFCKQHQRLADDIEFPVRSQTRKLHWPVPRRVGAEGLVVVPVKGVRQSRWPVLLFSLSSRRGLFHARTRR